MPIRSAATPAATAEAAGTTEPPALYAPAMSSIGPLLVLGIAGLVIIALVIIIAAVIVRASTGRSRRRSGYGPDGATLGGAAYGDSGAWVSVDDRHHDSGSGWFGGDSGGGSDGGSGGGGWFGGGDSGGGGGDGGGGGGSD